MNHDIWKTTDRSAETSEAMHVAFDRSDEFMDAYVDYCDSFVGSPAYERAFEEFASNTDGDDIEVDDDGEWIAYYGLHPEDEARPVNIGYED